MSERKFLDSNGVADRYGLHRQVPRRWRTEGKGPPYVKIGKRVLYPIDKLEEWERLHTVMPGAAA